MAPSEGMRPPIHFKNINSKFFLSKGNTGTKNGAETERQAIRDHLGIHPIHRHQTPTILLMLRSACRQQPGMVVLSVVLPTHKRDADTANH